ncbi:alpha/beta fold hydrolase [Streptomyces sp. N35]|uniref:alpha/beta fold hydrolase n=1 Tax=Streptomyces sp. N35 TaxID=2795730 RepID=UPI0018F547F4|nr:alpha/beta hydrolase [Streptomyces sp. N35]
MTGYVLVSGGYTGGWIWRDVAAQLRGGGAEVHPATLTGYGDRRHLAGPATDLETHVEDVVQLIEHADAPKLVLVGHCYGIFPVLGAADRRPERVERIVYMDTGMPEDGESVLDIAPAEASDHVTGRIARSEDGHTLEPPPFTDTMTWGSLEGIDEAGLERLARLAAPQPIGTLTQPLRLTGKALELPASGVFCTANGMSIALVEAVVAAGDRRAQRLLDPQVTLHDLPTGHWPMLSAPGELAEVLVRAAAGDGHRLVPAS